MFLVEWQLSATSDFATISMIHPGRWKEINAADNEIEKKLKINPFNSSQIVAEELRRIIVHPLAIYFSVDGNHVTVEAVGWTE